MKRLLSSIAIPIIAFCYPFLNNYTPYIDDLNRGLTGAYAWSPDGRPFSDLIYWVLNFGGIATPIFPAITIVAISFLIIIIYMICKENNLSMLYGLGLSTVVVNPFFSQPMLYKYDSALMIISIALTCTCFIKSSRKWMLLSVTLLFISIGMYQTSIAIYIALSLIEMVYSKSTKNSKEIIKNLYARAMVICAASISYVLCLKAVSLSSYAQEHSRLILAGDASLIKNNINSFISLFNSVTTSFSLTSVLIILCVVALVSVVYRAVRSEKKDIAYFSIIALACPCAAALSIFGISILLLHPVFEPRVLTASFVFIFFLISVAGYILPVFIRYAAVLLLIVLSLSTASVVNYSYLMSIKYNEQVYSSIREITSPDKVYSLYFYGSPRKSPYVAKVESKNPISEKINYNYFSGGLFSDASFNFNGINAYTKDPWAKKEPPQICESNAENQLMSACIESDVIYIKFK